MGSAVLSPLPYDNKGTRFSLKQNGGFRVVFPSLLLWAPDVLDWSGLELCRVDSREVLWCEFGDIQSGQWFDFCPLEWTDLDRLLFVELGSPW